MNRFTLGAGKFRKGFFTFKLDSISTNTEIRRSKTLWYIESNSKRETLLKYFRLRFLLFKNILSERELLLFFSFNEFFSIDLYSILLLEEREKIPLEVLLIRYERWCALRSKQNDLRRELLLQLENNVICFVTEAEASIGFFKKYSGYVRNSSSVGSKKSQPKTELHLNIEYSDENELEENIQLLNFLTVGKLLTDSGHEIKFP